MVFFTERYYGNLINKSGMEEFDVMEVYSDLPFGLGLNDLLTPSFLRNKLTPVWKREEE